MVHFEAHPLLSCHQQSLYEFPPYYHCFQLTLVIHPLLQKNLKHHYLEFQTTSSLYSFNHQETFTQYQLHAHKDLPFLATIANI